MRLSWIFGVGGALTFLGFALIPLPGPGTFFIGVGLILLLTGVALSEVSGRSEMTPAARPWWAYFVVGGVFWVAPAVALLVGYLAEPDYNASGQCVGIGFGCVPSPKDGIVFAAILGYPVCAVAGLLTMAVVAGTRAWRQRSR